MASTPEGAALTVAHRTAQLQIARVTQAQTLILWQMMDAADLDAAAERWAALQLQLIARGYSASAIASTRYLAAYGMAEIGTPTVAPAAPPLVTEAVLTSMRVTGPNLVKSTMARGATTGQAMASGLAGVIGSTQRHVLAGGRNTVAETVKADKRISGYARVPYGDPCSFCLMLASRGAVYGSEYSADFYCHDRCGCSVEPAYEGTGYELPPGARDARDLWDAFQGREDKGEMADFATGTYTHGKKAGEVRSISDANLTGFRRWVEGRTAPGVGD